MTFVPVASPLLFSIIVPDPAIRAALALYAGHPPFEALRLEAQASSPSELVLDDLPKHVRLGRLLDFLSAWTARQKMALPDFLSVSGGRIENQGQTMVRADGGVLPLTSRETDLLRALYGAPDHTLPRATLLSFIWGYVPDIETHTLETHIYRLRQKIEKDPSAPKTLVTTDKGYQFRLI